MTTKQALETIKSILKKYNCTKENTLNQQIRNGLVMDSLDSNLFGDAMDFCFEWSEEESKEIDSLIDKKKDFLFTDKLIEIDKDWIM